MFIYDTLIFQKLPIECKHYPSNIVHNDHIHVIQEHKHFLIDLSKLNVIYNWKCPICLFYNNNLYNKCMECNFGKKIEILTNIIEEKEQS